MLLSFNACSNRFFSWSHGLTCFQPVSIGLSFPYIFTPLPFMVTRLDAFPTACSLYTTLYVSHLCTRVLVMLARGFVIQLVPGKFASPLCWRNSSSSQLHHHCISANSLVTRHPHSWALQISCFNQNCNNWPTALANPVC